MADNNKVLNVCINDLNKPEIIQCGCRYLVNRIKSDVMSK